MKNIEIAILNYEIANGETIFGTPLTKQQLKEIKQKLLNHKKQGEEQLEYGL